MAAVTAAVIGVLAVGMTVYGTQEKKKADQRAADLNAQDSEENARLSAQRSAEDARQFRLNFQRDQSANVAAVGNSGIKMEGSPLEVLKDNASMAEKDYQNIKAGGEQQRQSYLRQANMYREGGAAAGRAGDIASASALLSGAGSAYSTGVKSGAWK